MNIFFLDKDVKLSAQFHNNKHVVKMILEYAQILSTVCNSYGMITKYRPTHKNHPCVKWAGSSSYNWKLLKILSYWLNEEYKFRFSESKDHKSWRIINFLQCPPIFNNNKTTPCLVMPDDCKKETAVDSYRNYYLFHKRHLADWGRRGPPYWWK